MSTEKRRKFALSGIFRRRRTDKPTEEVGIDLLHPVDDGDPTKSIPSNAGGSGDEDIGKVRNNPLTTCRILVYQLFFTCWPFTVLQVSFPRVQCTVTTSPVYIHDWFDPDYLCFLYLLSPGSRSYSAFHNTNHCSSLGDFSWSVSLLTIQLICRGSQCPHLNSYFPISRTNGSSYPVQMPYLCPRLWNTWKEIRLCKFMVRTMLL